jgi:hypothetical protein
MIRVRVSESNGLNTRTIFCIALTSGSSFLVAIVPPLPLLAAHSLLARIDGHCEKGDYRTTHHNDSANP